MRRIRMSMAMSLDGYIAGPNGEIDWIIMDPDIDFGALMGSFDTLVMGRKTYEDTKKQGGPGMPGMSVHVISRTLRPEDCPGASLSRDLKGVLTAVKEERKPKDVWLFGGGVLFRSALELGLVDAVEVAVMPVLLGGGRPLLPTPSPRTKLKLTTQRLYEKTGTVWLEYDRP